METRQLRYFVAVAEERHFGRAALRLHMAQPPLSHQIKQLEEQLGTQLLVRTTRKVELTPAGELLLVRARGLLAEIDQLGQDVKLVGQGASGVLRVGVVGSATYRLMPRIVETAGRRLPGLKLHVLGEMLTPPWKRRWRKTASTSPSCVRRCGPESSKLRFLEQDELVVALPEDHPLASHGSLELADLAGEKFVSYPRTSAVCGIFMDACRRVGFRPRIVQEASETSTLLAFVASGMGLALVPMTRRVFALQGTVLRPLRDAPAVDLALAWRRGSDARWIELRRPVRNISLSRKEPHVKIERIEAIPYAIPYTQPLKFASGEVTTADHVLVRVHTDTGSSASRTLPAAVHLRGNAGIDRARGTRSSPRSHRPGPAGPRQDPAVLPHHPQPGGQGRAGHCPLGHHRQGPGHPGAQAARRLHGQHARQPHAGLQARRRSCWTRPCGSARSTGSPHSS